MRTVILPTVLAGAVMLSGCMDTSGAQLSQQPQSEPPTNYRPAVLAYARQSYIDPYSIRDASISEPLPVRYGLTGSEIVWGVCVRANARNRMGGYTGLQESLFVFSGNNLDTSRSGVRGSGFACQGAVYTPFPELERLS